MVPPQSYNYHRKYKPPAPVTDITIATIYFEEMGTAGDVEFTFKALIDTGADVSSISNHILKQIELELGEELDGGYRTVRDFSGSVHRQKQVELKLLKNSAKLKDGKVYKFGNNKKHDFMVYSGEEFGIIGRDVLNRYHICLDGKKWVYEGERK